MGNKNYTSNHLDKSIIYLFLGAFLVSVTVFAYRYSKYSPCTTVDFKINSKDLTTGALIKFEDLTESAENWQWDFGDESSISIQQKPFHAYKAPGEYTVKLLVNDFCEHTETITITEKEVVIDSTKFPIFKLPSTIKVGRPLRVVSENDNATSWEWRFGETSSANAKTERASYTYKKPGTYTISLITNGELEYITKKKIVVKPTKVVKETIFDIPEAPAKPDWDIDYKPAVVEEKPEAPKQVPYISKKDFESKLILVSKEKLSPKQFSEYFCGDLNKPIIANGKSTTFLLLCEKIADRRIKIKKLELFREKGSNCITNLTIDYRKGLGLF
ncbi:PKD domain-containing protein [Lacinutrix salivirga]